MRRLMVLALLGLSGCSQTNLADVVKALAQDPASTCVGITSIYGKGSVARTNIQNGKVTCTSDGLAIESKPVDAKE